ncbi:MAG: EAL domain-containing protein [Rhodospirillales bacterium]|nr:EAL domain-containing protein [Rhodospirillales bacterium]
MKLERWIKALGIGLAVLVTLLSALLTGYERQQIKSAAYSETLDMARLYKAYTEQALGNLDQILLFLAAVEQNPDIADAKRNIDAILKQRKADSQIPINIAIADAEGKILHRTFEGANSASIREREHFKAHREGRSNGLFVTPAIPYLNDKNRFLFALSRKLIDAKGNFAGVVSVMIDCQDFSSALRQKQMKDGSTVALFHGNGQLVTRVPFRPQSIGTAPPVLVEFAQSEAREGTLIDLSPLDGVERLIGQTKLEDMPLIVAVTQNYDSVLEPWRVKALLGAGLWLAMMGGIYLAVSALLSRLRQQHRVQQQLEYTQAKARVGGWIWEIGSDRLIWTDETYRIFGLTPGEPVWRKAFFRRVHSEDLPRLEGRLKEAVENGTSYQASYRACRQDGEWRNIVSQGEVQRDATGKALRIQGVLQDVTNIIRTEQRLAELLELNQRIISAAPVGVGVYRADGQCVLVNLALAKMVGGTIEKLQAINFMRLDSWQRSGMREAALRVLENGVAEEIEAHTVSSFGREFWHLCRFVRFTSGGAFHFLMLAEDIGEKRKAEAELRLAASVYTNTVEGIVVTDADGIILSVNPAFTDITGYTAEEAVGETPRILKSDHHDNAFYAEMWSELKRCGKWQGELWNRRKNGEAFLEWQSITAIQDSEGKPLRYVAVFNDVTELRKKDERIKHQAYHDALTGLPNRLLLQDRLDHAIDLAKRDRSHLGLMFLDLDRFKTINDSLGHDVGDQLLQAVAERLRGCVRKSDTLARLGGDEFVLVLPDTTGTSEVAHVAEKIIRELVVPLQLSGHEVHVTTSLGIALFPDDGLDAKTLMKNADMAMYQAKEAGRNAFRFFDASMNSRALERLDLEASLRRAVERLEFELYYQPKVLLATGESIGAEALIRWRHPVKGLVPPGDFIPLAEETGLIVPIGEWAFKEACRMATLWKQNGLLKGSIAVNLSARQLQHLNLMEAIEKALKTANGVPSSIEIELTESVVMSHPVEAIAILSELRGKGFSIAVDDFGTGYSSLSYLKRLPISALKIDRSFVMDLPGDPEDSAIARTIIDLARSLEMETVAEGIETAEQAEYLRNLGCLKAQGFYFAKPMPASEFEAWLKDKANTSLQNE